MELINTSPTPTPALEKKKENETPTPAAHPPDSVDSHSAEVLYAVAKKLYTELAGEPRHALLEVTFREMGAALKFFEESRG